MHGRIFNIQKFCISDGPGIRTTVFFKGCNLNCQWCHNPESQSFEKEQMFHKNRCTGCGRCEGRYDEAFICYHEAREICGADYTVDEVLQEILKDKSYYEMSGGGVTFSGGECMLQNEFLLKVLRRCKEKGIHTAVDTAGHVPWEYFVSILPYTDLFLYDVKIMDEEKHKLCTGVTNHRILDNLKKLLELGVRLWVRVPIIPGVNDTEEEMTQLKKFFEAKKYPEKLELIPYHGLGEHKYDALGRPTQVFAVPEKELIEKLKRLVLPNDNMLEAAE